MQNIISYIFFTISLLTSVFVLSQENMSLNPVVENGNWIQPSDKSPAIPIWGHVNGIRVGIAPTSGPRGLLRIYAPYLGHDIDKMINFIAFEPIPFGDSQRGFSEIEMSNLDSVRGKRFWSSNDSLCYVPLYPSSPGKGLIKKVNGIETLSVFIFSEEFQNGALPYIKLSFFEDRPYEIELTTYSCNNSAPLDFFILSATMGNFARLRNIYLDDSIKSSLNLWPNYKDVNFTSHDVTHLEQMINDNDGGVYFIAAPNEEEPQNAQYSSDTSDHWKYYGKIATQYWYVPLPDKNLKGLVNGRYTYWASKSAIPGGVSYENFELNSPFKNGDTFIFGVSPLSVKEFIKQISK